MTDARAVYSSVSEGGGSSKGGARGWQRRGVCTDAVTINRTTALCSCSHTCPLRPTTATTARFVTLVRPSVTKRHAAGSQIG